MLAIRPVDVVSTLIPSDSSTAPAGTSRLNSCAASIHSYIRLLLELLSCNAGLAGY
jgi:hypothetical protein